MHLLNNFLIDKIGIFFPPLICREREINVYIRDKIDVVHVYTATDARVITDNSIIMYTLNQCQGM